MAVYLDVRNDSIHKRLFQRKTLQALASNLCQDEAMEEDVEISLLLCDDPFIQELNRDYRDKDEPTDVLSFGQEAQTPVMPRVLGDIVVSLETVEKRCGGCRDTMRQELRLLFCHGLLHLLGYVHDSEEGQERMQQKQARYLGVSKEAAWHTAPGK